MKRKRKIPKKLLFIRRKKEYFIMTMREMVDLLNKYAMEYYVLDAPTVSDKEYDELYDKLV